MEKTQKPLKRSEQLKSLSREHHSGLLFSWKIREGIRIGISTERLKGYLNYFVNEHLLDHFEKEETLLFNKVDDPVCIQAKKDHDLLKQQIHTINVSPVVDTKHFTDFMETLNEHIRFEERVVFPKLEEVMALQTLNSIHDELKSVGDVFKDEYTDEFWIRK